MRDKSSVQGIRDSYRKRQQMGPFIVGGIAVVLLVVGALFVALSFASGGIQISLFATKTPTPTLTYTPTLTPTVTETPTPTLTLAPSETPTVPATSTPSGPFPYKILEGDSFSSIAAKFGVDMLYLMQMNNKADGVIYVGEEIIIPPINLATPTLTPVPPGLPKGRVIEIVVSSNDSLNGLASKYNSTIDAILKENVDILTDATSVLFMGTRLKIPVNLVTPTKTTTPQISVRQTQTQDALLATPTP